MRSSRIRSLLVTAVVLALAGLGWFYLAPTQIGGSTRYMITHGVSMEPMLHTGDLVLVRPTGSYKVGQVVAYQSTVLHTVVLHRIHRIEHGRYTFKGDNNDFIDPTHPTRALLLGSMWLHIPHGGTVLDWVHTPWVAAALTGGVAMLLLFGGDQTRRRRGHRRHRDSGRANGAVRGSTPVTNRYLLAACTVGAALCAALSIFAFLRPTAGSATVRTPYTQELHFGYAGHTPAGSVYPNGRVTTGEPIYLQLVHQLTITTAYKLATTAPNRVHGSIRVRGTLSNDSGWSRRFWLGPLTRFSGDRGVARARVNLSRLQALSNRVSTQIGEAGGGSYTLAVQPEVKLAGEIGGSKVATAISPSLNLALGSGIEAGGSAVPSAGSSTGSASGSSQQGLEHSTPGSVTSTRSAVNRLAGVPVKTVRLIAIAAFVLFALLALLTGWRELRGAADPEKINSRYKHLIVPVDQITPDEGHPPIEVSSFDALAQLAERSERLILHEHRDDADSYMIDDQGTLFRYRSSRAGGTRRNGNRSDGVMHARAADGAAGDAGDGTAGGAWRDALPAETVTGGVHAQTVPNGVAAEAAAGGVRADPAASAVPAEPAVKASRTNGDRGARADSHNHSLGDAADTAERAATGAAGPYPSATGADHGRVNGARPAAPVSDATHWSRRPGAHAGFAIGPLALAFLAWRRLRKRRQLTRQSELDDRWYAPADRWHGGGRPQPPRGPGDRRRGERRRN